MRQQDRRLRHAAPPPPPSSSSPWYSRPPCRHRSARETWLPTPRRPPSLHPIESSRTAADPSSCFLANRRTDSCSATPIRAAQVESSSQQTEIRYRQDVQRWQVPKAWGRFQERVKVAGINPNRNLNPFCNSMKSHRPPPVHDEQLHPGDASSRSQPGHAVSDACVLWDRGHDGFG